MLNPALSRNFLARVRINSPFHCRVDDRQTWDWDFAEADCYSMIVEKMTVWNPLDSAQDAQWSTITPVKLTENVKKSINFKF